jgi:succinate dehydrogenase / fumarate reductase cytochrome b subunit
MAVSKRPLSPHLQVYRLQLTSVLSISHRATGILLAVGALALALWLLAAASGAPAFDRAQAVAGSWIGRLLLAALLFSLYFHLCNGIRHLVWDAGYGFDLRVAYRSGYAVLAASVLLTLITLVAAW